jgi:hypothetical protein
MLDVHRFRRLCANRRQPCRATGTGSRVQRGRPGNDGIPWQRSHGCRDDTAKPATPLGHKRSEADAVQTACFDDVSNRYARPENSGYGRRQRMTSTEFRKRRSLDHSLSTAGSGLRASGNRASGPGWRCSVAGTTAARTCQANFSRNRCGFNFPLHNPSEVKTIEVTDSRRKFGLIVLGPYCSGLLLCRFVRGAPETRCSAIVA